MKLHRFNDEGVNRFGQFLDALSADPAFAVPSGLLTDPAYVVPVPQGPEVQAQQFATRMDTACYLDNILSNIVGCDIDRDAGLWAWLSLFYFDQVCPVDGHGHRKVGERARYVPAVTNYQKYYRHLWLAHIESFALTAQSLIAPSYCSAARWTSRARSLSSSLPGRKSSLIRRR
jgi:hypothetical protein